MTEIRNIDTVSDDFKVAMVTPMVTHVIEKKGTCEISCPYCGTILVIEPSARLVQIKDRAGGN